ncbi:MAG TPA: TetR/AcrR family transcriptional regulator [Pseudonocardiaceae bacterium]
MTQTRRRGDALVDALYSATVDELTQGGYAGLTIERVAARAQTGKAAVYRRWPNKQALVLDTLRHVMPPLTEPDPDGTARDNLRQVFTALRQVLAGETRFPGLAIAFSLLSDEPLRAAFVESIVAPRLTVVRSILDRAERTGELPPGTRTPLAAQVGPALIVQTFMLTGAPPTDAEIIRIIDTVLSTGQIR